MEKKIILFILIFSLITFLINSVILASLDNSVRLVLS